VTGTVGDDPPVTVLVPALDLRIGSLVVYGGHGVGRVALTDDAGPAPHRRRRVVLEFAGGLSVTLPIERAVTCLRPLAGEVERAQVREVLRSRESRIEKSWQARTRSTRTKLADGAAVGLAEVVRDSALRQRGFSDGTTLSSHERELYLRARRLLAAELAAATESDEAGANAWIETQLDWVAAP
jgi:RNA polymerase-interacting CarD/CdnL/TRCF family regulator